MSILLINGDIKIVSWIKKTLKLQDFALQAVSTFPDVIARTLRGLISDNDLKTKQNLESWRLHCLFRFLMKRIFEFK